MRDGGPVHYPHIALPIGARASQRNMPTQRLCPTGWPVCDLPPRPRNADGQDL